MAAAILQHPPSGILLKDSLVPQPRSRHDSAVASSSTTSSSSNSNSRSPSTERSPRRIRFAPLPEPRRDDPPESVFFPDDSDDDPLPVPPSPITDIRPPSPSPSPSPIPSTTTTTSLIQSVSAPPPKSKSMSWGHKLLRPLLTSRKSYPATHHAPTTPDTPTTTTITNSHYKGGAPLDRRMSTGSSVFKSAKETERSTTYRDGAPLHPVYSETTAAKSLPRNGQRMLNGRVYGRRIPLAAAQDSYEPEFVEWGYGGMGSVDNDATTSSSSNGLDWAKVQSRGKIMGATQDDDQDADDGSGMGWVKRRREQRERERRQREEQEQERKTDYELQEAAAAVPAIAVHPPDVKDSPRKQLDSALGEGHLCEAISVPAPHHHHHHHHHRLKDPNATPLALSRDNSMSAIPTCPPALSPPSSQHNEGSLSSGSSATSTSSVDEDDGDEDEDDTERDSDDEDSESQGRLTSKGAGVEKISRHKE